MVEFFQGWRRKFGVVTLVMALVLMGGWMRSESRIDHLWISVNNVVCWFFSGGNSLRLMTQVRPQPFIPPEESEPMFHWATITNNQLRGAKFHNQRPVIDLSAEIVNRWPFERTGCWGGMGFEFERFIRTDDVKEEAHFASVSVPYWSITIPLTLKSLWLLLFKPRKSASNKAIDSIPTEGA